MGIKEVCATLALSLLFVLPAHGLSEPAAHVHRVLMTEAEAPRFVDGVVVFSYEPSRPVRYVVALFEHEDYAIQHVFERNPNGILVLAYDPPQEIQDLRYRLVVDGLTMPDPNNPVTTRSATEERLSVFRIPDRPTPRFDSPQILPDGRVEFTYQGIPGQRVFLSGSFTNWNPFLHRMEEVESGLYRAVMRVRAGTHYYQFLVDNQRIPDPRNPMPVLRLRGREVSQFEHPGMSVINARR